MEKLSNENTSDPELPPGLDNFKGFIQSFCLENETQAWELIYQIANDYLARYPTTLEEDYSILDKERRDPILTTNKRNCISYRYTEKVVLKYLKDCSKRV